MKTLYTGRKLTQNKEMLHSMETNITQHDIQLFCAKISNSQKQP